MEESLVTPGHMDLWMKDLSPDDSRVRDELIWRRSFRETFTSKCVFTRGVYTPRREGHAVRSCRTVTFVLWTAWTLRGGID